MFLLLQTALYSLAVSAVLYHVSPRFRYLFRYGFMYSFALCAGACCIPQGLLYRPCDLRNGGRFVRPLRCVSWALGIHWRVEGLEHLKGLRERGAVIVSNHQSAVDVLGMVELWPDVHRLASVIKREVWLGFPFALAAWLCGQIFINRRDPEAAKKTLSQVADRLDREKIKLWVFPEGTRGDGVNLLPFKKGAFHMAVSAGVPVLPVVFSSYRSFLDGREWKWTPGEATVRILPAVDTAGMSSGDDIDQLTRRTQQLIADTFKQLSRQSTRDR
nr:AGPAT1-like protein [Parasacculina yatsui]